MTRPLCFVFLLVCLVFSSSAAAQKRRLPSKPKPPRVSMQKPGQAVVVDDRLSVLLAQPSLAARPMQRMRRGRKILVTGEKEADGVVFYRIVYSRNNSGWMQGEAVAGSFRRDDDERLVKLIQASEGFEQIERALIFLDIFPASALRPAILLLTGDLLEETSMRISKDAARRLDRREMAASGAPLHSFYLNFSSLDRYRRLGIGFLFNARTKALHYNGATWREIIRNFPSAAEAGEAQKRLDALKEKMEKKG